MFDTRAKLRRAAWERHLLKLDPYGWSDEDVSRYIAWHDANEPSTWDHIVRLWRTLRRRENQMSTVVYLTDGEVALLRLLLSIDLAAVGLESRDIQVARSIVRKLTMPANKVKELKE